MNFDNYENVVLMPRWEASDPFGRGAIRKARWEYTQMRRERDALKNELEAVYGERSKAVNMLVEALHTEQKRVEELRQMIAECDKARKSLGEKLKVVTEERDDLQRRLQHEHELYQELLKEYANLEDDHDALIRSVTDKHEALLRSVTDKHAEVEP